jgi:uncharacterized protein (DUF2267 family)
MPGLGPEGEVQAESKRISREGTVQYEEFISKVAQQVGMSRAETEKLAAAVIRTLGERLSGGEAEDLRAQLPEPLKGDLISTREEAEGFGVEEFARRVAEKAGISEEQAGAGVVAVLDTVGEAVSPGEFDDVLAQLGREFAQLIDSNG